MNNSKDKALGKASAVKGVQTPPLRRNRIVERLRVVDAEFVKYNSKEKSKPFKKALEKVESEFLKYNKR